MPFYQIRSHPGIWTSTVLMTYWSDNVIVHVKKFVIAFVSVNRCLGLAYRYGLFHESSPSLGLSIYHFYSLQVHEKVFGGCVVCEGEFVGGGLRLLLLTFLCILYIFIWIYKTKAVINRDEGNYELPQVYDDIF